MHIPTIFDIHKLVSSGLKRESAEGQIAARVRCKQSFLVCGASLHATSSYAQLLQFLLLSAPAERKKVHRNVALIRHSRDDSASEVYTQTSHEQKIVYAGT